MATITVETKKTKRRPSRVNTWIKEHTVELLVGGGVIAVTATGFVLGMECGVSLARNKITEDIPDLIDKMGSEGYKAAMEWIRLRMPDVFDKVYDKLDPIEVQHLFYSRVDVHQALLSVKK